MSKKNTINIENVERFNVDSSTGLSIEQVFTRINQGLTNKSKVKIGKTYLEIIFTDLFSFFNILLFVIAGFMIAAKYYDGLFFLSVLIPNIVITLYEDLHARYLLGKLNLINQSSSVAIRNGSQISVKSDDIVLDDILILSGNNQVNADGIILEGTLLVNEALLTGESKPVKKEAGDLIYAGSFTVSGRAIVKVEKVGENNYIETIHSSANKFKRTPSEIKNSLRKLFWVVGGIVIAVSIATFVVYATQHRFTNPDLIEDTRISIFGSMVAMIPSGMFLLTSAVFSLSVINLAKRNAQIQDFYSVEMLSKINVLCVDKTGTITDGNLLIQDINVLNNSISKESIMSILKTIITTTNDNNVTAKAILDGTNDCPLLEATNFIRFNSDNKYSAITIKNSETFVLGAVEFINIMNKETIQAQMDKYAELGLRVLVLGRNYSPIKDDKISGQFEAVALVVLEDHIKEDAKEIFEYFIKNNVDLKVISGDNAKTVSFISQKVGIPDAEKYISLEGMNIEQVKEIANQYTVFGRVSPEQKEAIIMSIKSKGNKVAMTGDGVNDILALKRSDCSIAMANGSDAARNVANIVLLDSNFKSLPNVVSEGRRIINNVQRTSSLFLTKTCFAMFFAIAFLVVSVITKDPTIAYPYRPNHLYLWEICGIGMSGFFLALEKNENKYSGGFLKNVLKKALPGGMVVILATLLIYLLKNLQDNGVMNFGIIGQDTITAMTSTCFSLIGLVILYDICSPLNLYRGIVFGSATLVELGVGAFAVIKSVIDGNSDATILRIPFESMTTVSWFMTVVVFLFSAFLYLLVVYIIKILSTGDKNNVKD